MPLSPRAAELQAASPSRFAAIRRNNAEDLIAWAFHPTMFPLLAEDRVLIEAEHERRIELIETASERLDACVRQMRAGDKAKWAELERIIAEEAEELAVRRAA